MPGTPERSVTIEAAKRAGHYHAADFEGAALNRGAIRVLGDVLD